MKTSESFIPIYYRLADDIKQQIISGQLKPGDSTPTESQLCNQYGISRMTVRQGLKLLAEEGLVESFRGKGSFVTYPKFNELLIELPDSQFNNLKEANMRLLGVDVVLADRHIASALKLRIGSKVIRLRKLYLSSDEPIALDTRYIIYRKGQPVIENEIHYAAFPKFVTSHTGFVSIRNQVTFSAILIDNEVSKILETTESKPGLKIEQLVFGAKDQPLGWSIIICNGEKYSLNGSTKTYIE